MNKNKSQQGSAHLVVIIVLVIALLGAVGYIFWQNFMQVKVNDSDLTQTSKTLSIPELGIEGSYSGNLNLLYQIKQNNDKYKEYELFLYSSDTDIYSSVGSTCNNGIGIIIQRPGEEIYFLSDSGGAMTVSDMYKARVADGLSDSIWHIGDYYYEYVSPQSYCRDESGEILPGISDVLSSMQEFFAGAKSIE